jgi:hypothetical protein
VTASTSPRDAGSNGANGEAPVAAGIPAAVSVTVTDYGRNARITQDVTAARRGVAEQGAR